MRSHQRIAILTHGYSPAFVAKTAISLLRYRSEDIAAVIDQTAAGQSALPIIADEDCQIQSDIQRCSGLFHGVNVKICKCGGLTPALTMLLEARELGMATMVDYADLDGAVLLKDDPAQDAAVINGAVTLSQQPGCGAELIRNRLDKFPI